MLNLQIELPRIDTGPFVFGATKSAKQAMSFAAFIREVNPRFQFYAHAERLITVLQRVADGELDRLLVFMPPRHSKSETVSRLFTAYYLYRYPERWVGLNSYAAELAYTLSRNARENYTAAGGLLNEAAYAVRHWETQAGGGLWAAGVGGPITGKGFHLGVIDDPLKNAEEASSATVREKQKDWYRSTFYTRAEPNAAIVVIQTRWNEDDLSGWLLNEEQAGDHEAEGWHIVNMPAIAEEAHPNFPASCTVEPDDRAPGEALCSERYPLARLRKIMQRIGSYFWNALFQQRPTALEGGLFKRGWFDVVGAVPGVARRVRYWDKAGTQDGGDYSCGALLAADGDGVFYVVDVVRGQWSALERERIIRQTAEMDGRDVPVWVEQEPGSGGKESAQATIRSLAGWAVHAERVTGDKLTRAQPFAAQCEALNVKLVRGSWNAAYLEELELFPNAKHDDQIDASSGAFAKLAQPDGLSAGQLVGMFRHW